MQFVKRKLAGLIWLLCCSAPLLAGPAPEGFDYRAYARVLENHVTEDGRVRYGALQKDRADLQAFVAQLRATSPANRPELFPAPEDQMAYWINAYNAFVLQAVVEEYPVKSVRDFKFGFGLLFFKRAKFVAGGKEYSLDDIEHGILRRRFAEPRIHFALNCASTSCPPLAREPYLPEKLEAQLDTAARNFINREENVWMRGDVLFLSKIFDWYGQDFVQYLEREGAAAPTAADYVARYLPDEVAARVRQQNPRVEFYGYDWALNDAKANRAD